MNGPSLRPARIDFSGGVPQSLDHGDDYHSAAGAGEQARHVFLAGNQLPQRWRGRRHFAILETGFGLGHNFLATWVAWRADPDRCEQLHYVSLELHPPSREDLAKAHQAAQGQGLPDALVKAWPPLLQGLHVLRFEEDTMRGAQDVEFSEAPGTPGTAGATSLAAVHLTLAWGDARHLLPSLVGPFDAFFLDGFAPSMNPDSGDSRLLRALGRMAAPGATAATWSAAQVVRKGLQSAGFVVGRAPGWGDERAMTVARFAPRVPQRIPAGRPQAPWTGERRAVVIGAGLAGATAAQALARQGWECTVLDGALTPASGASGNPAGLFHGVVHRDDGVHARLHRHAALGAARHYGELIRQGAVEGCVEGLLGVRGDDQPHMPDAVLQAMPDLPAYMQGLSQQEASAVAGVPLSGPALHFLQGGWVDPSGVVRHALASRGVQFQGGAQVGALRPPTDGAPCWSVLDMAGAELARAPVVVLAAGTGLPPLAHPGAACMPSLGPLEVTRGQINWFHAQAPLTRPITGHGYAVRLPDGRLLFGASLRPDDQQTQLMEQDLRWNLERLRQLTGLEPTADAPLGGRVSWRLQTPDRLPLIGPLPRTDLHQGSRQDQARFIARQPGLYMIGALGSRGLIWAPLAAQMLCAWVESTPMPLEADLLDALDPARWLVRQARRAVPEKD